MQYITKPSNHQTTSLRLSDIHKLISGRYDGPCRTANGERYLMAAIPELMPRARSWHYGLAWARDWTPILLEEHGEDFIRRCWTKVATRKCRKLTTDQLAALLAVVDDEPARLNLRCIPAASRTAEIRDADRKASKAKAEAVRRAAKPGHTPRSESLKAKAPWKAAGMNRTDWYANRRAERLTPVTEPGISAPDDFVDTVSAAPLRTISWTPDPLQSLQPISGQGGTQDVVPANDDTPPAPVESYRGHVLDLPEREIAHILFRHPMLAHRLRDHLGAIDRAMRNTPEPYRKRVLRNLLQDESRKAHRMARLAA